MKGEMRRSQMLELLRDRGEPISGTALAKTFQVSRQVIVQDIALLRAEHHSILSTNKGYFSPSSAQENRGPFRVFCLQHRDDQVLEEMLTVIELGGRILDVAVEHELFGQIRVDLLIETAQDARHFVGKMLSCQDKPLKSLTKGCHYHTVEAPSKRLLDLIEEELRQKGFLQPIQG